MNTVLKGDLFEKNSYELIRKAIDDDKFGISPKFSKVFLKKGYFSRLRNKEIVFDLSIEIWPPDAERLSILYLIECKNYSSKKVPVDDIEEFLSKVSQIADLGYFIKGVFISNNSFQDGAIEIAKKAGIMLIEVTPENELSIKLHKTERKNIQITNEEKEIEAFLFSVFDLNRVEGLKKYSRKNIEDIVIGIINEIDDEILKYTLQTPINKTIEYFKFKYNLKFEFENELHATNGKQIHGYFDVTENIIKISKNVVNTERFSFLLAHELGHFILHRNLRINQQVYDIFEDAEYDFLADKYLLNNYKNWIEWQANEFASSFILPSNSFYTRLILVQKSLGISKYGHIYLDDQPINRQDFKQITNYLSQHFNTTYTSVLYKLENLELITYDRRPDNFKEELRNFYNETILQKL